jgi:GT2 family glycosyltransferase
MILVFHNGKTVIELIYDKAANIDTFSKKSIASVLVEVAKECPDEILVWCHQNYKEQLNVFAIEALVHHKKVLLSYNPSEEAFLDSAIGYIDTSLFVKLNKAVTFPTWQMSSAVGGIYAEVLLALNNKIPLDSHFDYFLCSLAKLAMPKGLLCYSEPQLLKKQIKSPPTKTSQYELFRFVKQHYKMRWSFLLLMNLFLYERKLPLFPFLFSLFYKNRSKTIINLDTIKVQSSKKVIDKATVDVIIPTIGRKSYLYDVLKDFSKQTLLPKKIIIVEQNPLAESKTELDYITNENWPFEIYSVFTHQAGACNARNLALKETKSEWVFLADDDIRIEANFIKETLDRINIFGVKAVTLRCLKIGEKQLYETVFQWGTFGSGCSFVLAESIRDCHFKMGYEFGYGEDGDFGMQIRNQGYDVLYLPEPEILHLKAPVGGFRTQPVLQWHKDKIQPKPSPTVMLYQMTHCTKEQINSYKTTLFFKYYRLQSIKNPLRYYSNFQKQWGRSVFWANELRQQNEV